jgi:hypothetical protein
MSTQLTGAAGEFFVAAELSRRGWAASITPKGVQRTDVLAQHVETGRVVALQVKSTTTGTTFTLGEKNESESEADNEWFVFVSFVSTDDLPVYFILPRNDVAKMIYLDHRVWLSKTAKSGKPHQDNPRRTIYAKHLLEKQKDWSRLLRPTSEITDELSPYYQQVLAEAGELGLTTRGIA